MVHTVPEGTYHPQSDVEELEGYTPGGFQPTIIGDAFCNGRYELVHKLGYDSKLSRYVSLKILIAQASRLSRESEILYLLTKGDSNAVGRQIIPPLLDEFFIDGPNGHHRCLVTEPAGTSIAGSKETSSNFMFPRDAARSVAAQLIMGLSYLHANNSETYLYLRNFLLRVPNFDKLSTSDSYHAVDGKPNTPNAPPHAILPPVWKMPANRMTDPEIVITDYGTSFIASQTPFPTLRTPALYSLPEGFFQEPITIPTAADVWTLGVVLYEILGERPVFETFSWNPDDIISEMISTLGQLPARWWISWENRPQFFNPDGSWISDYHRIATPVFRRLHQRMWDMGRGEAPETCE
ncbi:kinase-like domain-containing protein [Aspergillus undulatus]|uniref:kinase-like domain-containing protein n=1 Tax=Aspergillus undulatus TaxID=1810928 RepID=UPI003CCD2A01